MPTPAGFGTGRFLSLVLASFLAAIASVGANAQAVASGPIAQVYGHGTVNAIAVQPDGKVIVGGSFSRVNGVARSNIARFNTNGTLDATWSPNADDIVNALAIDTSGNVYVGGSFQIIGGQIRHGIAKLTAGGGGGADPTWNPSASAAVSALALDASGSLYVGGSFTSIGGQARNRIAKLTTGGSGTADATWDPNASSTISAIVLDGSGNVFVGGAFGTIGGQTRARVAKLSASGAGAADGTWDPSANGFNVYALVLDGAGSLFVGGDFGQISGQSRSGIAKISTTGAGSADGTWNPSADSRVRSLVLDGAGDIYVGGDFSTIGGASRTAVAKLLATGTGAAIAWDAAVPALQVGSSLPTVNALVFTASRLHAGGAFQTIGGQTKGGFATLSAFGATADPAWPLVLAPGTVWTLARDSAGRTIIGGSFIAVGDGTTLRVGIARFNADSSLDAAWAPNTTGGTVYSLAVDSSNNVYAGGSFVNIGGLNRDRLAKLSPTGSGAADAIWNPGPNGDVTALAVDGSGNVYAGGVFLTIGGQSRFSLAKLSGSGTGAADATWDPNPGFACINALVLDGSGNLYVAGCFTSIGGQPIGKLARISASGTGAADATWTPSPNLGPLALAFDGAGSLYVGGSFTTIGGLGRTFLAKIAVAGAGAADAAWNPSPDNQIRALALDGSGSIYAGGSFSNIGGRFIACLAKLSTSGSGAASLSWTAPSPCAVLSLAVSGVNLHVGGTFRSIASSMRAGYAVLVNGVPDAPVMGAASAGNGQAAITFAPPATSGTGDITGYTVTASPGGLTASQPVGSTIPIVINGLTNGTAYTFTVTASNSVGTGPPSAASNSVTPSSNTTVANFQGDWWRPSESGWGVNIQHQSDTLRAAWFTYDTDGTPMWLQLSSGTRIGSTTAYSGDVYRYVAGPALNTTPWNQGLLVTQNVGFATFVFTDANNGSFTYWVNGVSQTKTITKFVFATPLPTCVWNGNLSTDLARAINYQDTWANPAEGGWSLSITHQGDVLFANWFTYDASGKAKWFLLSNGAKTGPGNYSGTLYEAVGNPFDSSPWIGASVSILPVGTMSLSFTNGNSGTMTATVNGNALSKSISRFLYFGGGTICGFAPTTPAIGTATAGAAQATVSFSPSSSDGGFPLTYTATSNPGGITASGSASPLTVTGLTNGTAYTFTVSAANPVGSSPSSGASNSITPTVSAPGAPTIGLATAGNGQITIAFTPPASNGGSPITSYTVTCNPGGISATGPSSPITVTGLTNGITYTCTVTATNSAGTGTASSVSNAASPGAVVAITPMAAPNPTLDYGGGVGAIAATSDGGYIVGGRFRKVSGAARRGLARLGSSGSLDPAFDPSPNGDVSSLAVAGSSTFVAGAFTQIGGIARPYLAKVSTTSGAVDAAFAPAPDGAPTAIATDANGNVYAAGNFATIGGVSGRKIVKLDPASGNTVAAWNPSFPKAWDTASGSITLAVNGPWLYASGRVAPDVNCYAGQLLRIDLNTGIVDAGWVPSAAASNGGALALAFDASGNVFAGGSGGLVNVDCSIPQTPAPILNKLAVANGAVVGGFSSGAVTSGQPLAIDSSGLYVNTADTSPLDTDPGLGGPLFRKVVKLDLATGAQVWQSPGGYVYGPMLAQASTLLVGGESSLFAQSPVASSYGIAALDTSVGTPLGGWTAQVFSFGAIRYVSVTPDGKYVIGGTFDFVDGQPSRNVARLHVDATVDSSWTVGVNGGVYAMHTLGDALYVTGYFTRSGSTTRNGAAKFSLSSATLDPSWNPNVAGGPRVVLATAGSVYLGGWFTVAGGVSRPLLAKVDDGSGALISGFVPPISLDFAGLPAVRALALVGGYLYAGGQITTFAIGPTDPNDFSTNRRTLVRMDPSTGALDPSWDPNTNSSVRVMLTSGTDLFIGGSFGSLFGVARNRVAKFNGVTGALDPAWSPGAQQDANVCVLVKSPTHLYVAGFSGKVSRHGLTDGALDVGWAPSLSGTSGFSPSLCYGGAVSASADRVVFPANGVIAPISVSGQLREGLVAFSLAPPSAPGAPTIATVTPGNAQATISFNTPGSDGGAAITSYTVTCNPGGITAVGSSSPITVTGLTNGVTYTCTITATSAVGTSSSSAATIAFVPSSVAQVPISTTQTHALALDSTGKVYAWGSDSYGQLGQGRAINRPAPVQVADLPAIAHISFSGHVLAVDTLRQVWSWGDNSCGGQLGPRESSITSKPSRVTGATNMTKVAAGGCFSLALKVDGTVWAWGEVPGYGGDTGLRQLPGLSGIVDIAAGVSHALALRNDGVVFAFGDNTSGVLGTGAVVAAASAAPVLGLSSVTAIYAGRDASMALSSGQVYFWGRHADRSVVTTPTPLASPGGTPVSIALADRQPFVARGDGVVLSYNAASASWSPISGFAGIGKVFPSAQGFTLAIGTANQLFASGDNTAGALGQGDTAVHAGVVSVLGSVSIAAASNVFPSALALKSDGTLWFWGADTLGQSGNAGAIGSSVPRLVTIGATVKAIATGNTFSAALDTAGNVWGWGDNRQGPFGSSLVGRSTPALIPGIANVQAIAAGGDGLLLYLLVDGTVKIGGTLPPFSAGYDSTFVSGLSSIVAIAAGSSAYALRNDGVLFAWGDNANGELGNGTTTASATPVAVLGITGMVTRIAAGELRAAAVTSDGKAWVWGAAIPGTFNGSLVATAIPGVTDAADISIGSTAVFVKRQNGAMLAWGSTILADAIGANLSQPYTIAFHQPVQALKGGSRNSLGFLVGSSGLAWGFGTYGEVSTSSAAIGDGAYVPRDRPVVLLAPNGAGSVDSNDWYLDLDPASAETIPTGSTPGALGVSRLFGSDAGLSLDATVKYKSADYGKAVNNYVFALVPPEFFGVVQTAPGTLSVAQIKAIAQARTKLQPRDGVSVLAQLTPTGWTFVQAQLIAYSQSVANAVGSSVNILNSFDASQIPGGRFCIGYGENSGSMLSFGALREVLLLPGASSNLSGVPCVLTGLYVDGPASSRFGSAVTFKGSVVGLQPTGTIQFTDASGTVEGPKPMSSDNQAVGSATLTTASLALGAHAIGGIYAGNSQNAAVASEVPVPHVVVQAPPGGTTTSLAGPTSSDLGSTAAFTALVAGDSPTGSVQFKDGANNLGDAVPLVGGVATLRVSTLGLGAHSLSATYSGNSTNLGSSSNTFTHTVYSVLTTRVSLTSSPNPSLSAQSITLTTTVTGDIAPTGSVTFRDGGATLATVGLANGVASTTVSGLSAGTHQLIAEYSGDANNQAVSSPVLIHQVALPNDLLNPPRMKGISTRMQVLTGNDVMIGGFILGGTAPKTVAVRARGPSMRIPGTLADPMLQLVPADGSPVLTNDNWQSASNAAALEASGFAPGDPKEAALLVTLNPGAYTAIVSGANNATGIAIVEVYEVDHPELPTVGISTRGKVLTGDDVMIGGFIIQGDGPQTVVVRGRGPSLGIPGTLADPYLQLVPAAGGPVLSNDDWQQASNAAALDASGFAPPHPKDAAMLVTLQPGAYTAIVSGVGTATGIAIVEVYRVGP